MPEEGMLSGVASAFLGLQIKYLEWGQRIHSYEELVADLTCHGMEPPEPTGEDPFTVFSSSFNGIMNRWMQIYAPIERQELLRSFRAVEHGIPDSRRASYLLRFLHPLRHELYYYGHHFDTPGLPARLAYNVRSHRQGLKGLRTRLNNMPHLTLNDRYLNAVRTTIAKHLSLHPETSGWPADLPENLIIPTLAGLELGVGELSNSEGRIAVALASGRYLQGGGNNWLRYSPCAINEGPIFTLRAGHRHLDCFEEVQVAMVNHDEGMTPAESTAKFRQILYKYYNFMECRLT